MKKNCNTCKHGYVYANPYCEVCLNTGWVSKWEPKEMEEQEMNIHVEETKETKLNYRERLIEDLKAAGQSIIDNAESIIGSEKWLHQVQVMITLNPSEVTMINVDRDFYPEGVINSKS